MLLVNVLAFWWLFFQQKIKWGYPAATTIILAVFFISYKKTKEQYPYILISFLWTLTPYPFIALVTTLLALLVWKLNSPVLFTFDEIGLSVKSFITKKYQWNELQYSVLKDDILTIAFANNKYLQENITPDNNQPDEKIFNEFCQQQIVQSHH